ncbi:glucosaminidase domain-containing protein [Salinilacustrithrix flava]|uniref:glucosaminidase domain-containing protein n=1 Tax=Salinilacustrithrix flava TaxID=2957203 RepID=UPI003D7C2A0F
MNEDHALARARTARRALVLAGSVLVALALGAGLAGAQEAEPSPAGEPTEDPAATSTTQPPPPTTIVLPDGDFGVIPPGATGPGAPPPEEALPPDGLPPEGFPPDGGELPVPEELPVVILPDPTPGLNAALADIDVTSARRRLVAAALPAIAAQERAAATRDAMRGAIDARRAAVDQAVAARSRLDVLAVNALMYGDPAGLEPIEGPETLDDLRDRELRDVVTDHVDRTFDQAVDALRDAIHVEEEATAVHLVAERERHEAERGHLLARADLARAIAQAEEARRQVGPAILGLPVLDAGDLVAWYRTYYAADPPFAPITAIVDAYLAIGAEEGVTADIAFAQAILETGGFTSGHARGFNFAGIGAYDHCAPACGFRFPDLDAGVRAHLHLLRAYADPALTSAQLAAPPNPLVAPERVGVRGCCSRWTGLTGVWATDPNYDRKVLGIYRLMVETARSLDRLQT